MKSSICCADVLVPQEKLHKFELVYLLVDALSVYHPDRRVRDGFFIFQSFFWSVCRTRGDKCDSAL